MWYRTLHLMKNARLIILSAFLFNGISYSPLVAADVAAIDGSGSIPSSIQSLLDTKEPDSSIQAVVAANFGSLPLSFEASNGQVDKAPKFLARGDGYVLFLTSGEVVLRLRRSSEKKDEPLDSGKSPQRDESTPVENAVIRLKNIAANPDPKVTGIDELPGKSNYFIGNDPTKWRTNVSTYAKVRIEDVYPGIDLVYYGNQHRLEFDWIVAPGADPEDIRFSVKSKADPEIDSQGNLKLDEKGELRLNKPLIYQERDGDVTEIAGKYVFLEEHEVGIQVNEYDTTLPLVIDPVLVYSTYLGGSRDDRWGGGGGGIAVDPSGNVYVSGYTESTDFPTADPFQANYGGGMDAFVTKMNAAGNALVYSAYLCGSGNDLGYGIAVDASGNAFVTGGTDSADFPTADPFQANHGGDGDAFVTKLNAAGNGLVYSTYLGGSRGDSGHAIALDTFGNAYVTGETNSFDFHTENPFQASKAWGSELFVTKFNEAGDALIYSTYVGGSGDEYVRGIAVDTSGRAYVAGITDSVDFPTANSFQASYNGSWDAFVTKLSTAGNALAYSSYLGGSGYDYGWGIAVDASGNAYVTGLTDSADFPTADPFQATLGGDSDVFVTKLNAAGNALAYSTYLGGSGSEYGLDIAVDIFGNAYVTGRTGSVSYPVANPFQGYYGGGDWDAFVTKLNIAGDALAYSTYLGGSNQDEGRGITVDSSGNIYVTGLTLSTDFPTVDPFQDSPGGRYDVFITKISLATPCSDLTLNSGGAATCRTGGGDGDLRVGYAELELYTGDVPYGVAVFQYEREVESESEPELLTSGPATKLVTVSEAGVPSSSPTTSAKIFIDFRNDVPAVPGRPKAGTIDINTGIPLANHGSATSNVAYTLRNMEGATLSTGKGTIEAGNHFAKFINELVDVAPDFVLPADFPVTVQYGSLEISSDQPLSVIALRGTVNQRKEFLMTTTTVANLTETLNSDPAYFPQFVDGGGYTTSLILMNTSGETETGTFQIIDEDGNPLAVAQAGGQTGSTFKYEITVNGVYRFQTDGSPESARIGWVKLTPDGETSTPIGSGVFGYNPADMLLTESGISAAMATTHAHIYVDLSGNYNTGLAIANVTNSRAQIALAAYQLDGLTGVGTSSEPLELSGNGHTAQFADQFITGLPPGFTGVLDISSATPFAGLTVRSLVNERNDYLITTFPVADATRTPPAPVVFPHIADRGGYRTQFILISPVGGASATLNCYEQDGTPWDTEE